MKILVGDILVPNCDPDYTVIANNWDLWRAAIIDATRRVRDPKEVEVMVQHYWQTPEQVIASLPLASQVEEFEAFLASGKPFAMTY